MTEKEKIRFVIGNTIDAAGMIVFLFALFKLHTIAGLFAVALFLSFLGSRIANGKSS